MAPSMLPNGSVSSGPHVARKDSGEGDGVTDTEFLIVGAGPAGASLACFLAAYNLKGLMISTAPGTANSPRAHITNMAALECLRDIGLDRELERIATKNEHMVHTRWCHSMAGVEYARIHSWGHDPRRKGDYETASPCSPVDLPQTHLEPVLVRHATLKGWTMRFNTTLESFTRDADTGLYIANIHDGVSGARYRVRTPYIFGADGARSQVVKQVELPLSVKPSQGLAINVLVKADLSHLMGSRPGNLHWILQPDEEHPEFGWMGIVRMVKAWDEWMFILFPTRGCDHDIQPSLEEYRQRVQEFIGDNTPAEILSVSKWYINEIVAERYSDGNVFCLGDAVHRHPPMNGLGSNTCIQDAFNLAWKVAYVHGGLAGRSILDTYSIERQPVGRSIITRANQAFRDHFAIWDAIGALPPHVEERRAVLQELQSTGEEGTKRRAAFREAISRTAHEFHGLGVEMNQLYTGPGIHLADEKETYKPKGRRAEDDVLYYEPSTYPGCRLPHVWLNTAVPGRQISTIDLAGGGAFTLFTGPGGDAWKAAAGRLAKQLAVPLNAHSIGFRQDWEDVYFDWERVNGVEEDGAVLVRPDRFVAWRAPRVLGDVASCQSKLSEVLRSILGLDNQL
ncbi:FAD binding domain protein [Aspergillus fischeri NRRL 181]|uniref:FAD binding domain protein n=1 Tax=Neosartorya fischeri (strain ATCC 1020 / DSM 3700 / CBS 544.65 / FGSC A1164 / JCM 1740 / NRRL 181 / WB 181) TaxID=331117 RepID=A1DKS3_NEOFI|nr:FAD binding domain protein [Aspergillus fischeri NRRL 181]EAW15394.1 FAD binding domain protein [Aspergillus fischeri NRRL 181]KAG2016842.1 hypothetical protein GB937_006044 [Aspergillus fischeri]